MKWLKGLERVMKRYPIYFGVIGVTIIYARETFPFSFYPMYNSFPNWSYAYYIMDNHDIEISPLLDISHGNIYFLFEAEADKQKISLSNNAASTADLQKIGENVIDRLLTDKEIDLSITDIYLYRIFNHIEDSKLISDTIQVASYHVQ